MKQVITELNCALKNKKVLIGCSTGVDSMVLLTLVETCLPKEQIIVAHVNHKKRAQSEQEEIYIKSYCKDRQIACHVLKLDEPLLGNFQETARKKRYAFFKRIADEEHADVLLLAHHADDLLETMLMRFMKASSLKGYAGMTKYTDYQGLPIYRPLLECSKQEIINYAIKAQIHHFEDASNQEDQYTRNRIRKYITPLLVEENPNLYHAIKQYQETLLGADALLEKAKLAFIETKVMVNNNVNNHFCIQFQVDDFKQQTAFLQIQLLFQLLKPCDLSRACIDDISKQILSSKQKIITFWENKLTMIKEYGFVQFINERVHPLLFYQKITQDGKYQLPNDSLLEVNKNMCNFSANKINIWYNIEKLPIIVRTRKDGDQIKFRFGTKKVSDYLTDLKVPYLERENLLFLCDDHDEVKAVLGKIKKG